MDISGSPMEELLASAVGGSALTLGRGTKISQPMQHSQKKKKNQKPYMVHKTYNILLYGNTHSFPTPARDAKHHESRVQLHLPTISPELGTQPAVCAQNTLVEERSGDAIKGRKSRNKFKC